MSVMNAEVEEAAGLGFRSEAVERVNGDGARSEGRGGWPWWRCVLLRFALIYFGLYFQPFEGPFLELARWVGVRLMGLPASGPDAVVVRFTGSGDTIVRYLLALCYLAIAAAGTVVWTIVRRVRRGGWSGAHPWGYEVLRVVVRYGLAFSMLQYGFMKCPPTQFALPGPERWMETYGQTSPMGLLWTFMGASPAYTAFTGAAELVAGTLLLFRRTTTLGALVAIGVMSNVVMLNMCYDVPVKLYSLHLLGAAVALVIPDVGRLVRVLVLNRPAPAAPERARPRRRWVRWGMLGVKAVVLVLVLGVQSVTAWLHWRETHEGAPPPLFGLYEVESFEVTGNQPAGYEAAGWRWRQMAVGRSIAAIRDETHGRQWVHWSYDAAAGTLRLWDVAPPPTGKSFTLTCERRGDGRVVLSGPSWWGDVKVTLRDVSKEQLLLETRGFRWVQEYPFNR